MIQKDNLENMSELFDDRIKKTLKQIGYIFPENAEDFKKIEEDLSLNPLIKPPKLANPLSFLSMKDDFSSCGSANQSLDFYESSFSQAAREGGELDENTLNKMKEDREASQKKGTSFLNIDRVGKC